jgi:uncharacterized membrane protein
MIIGFGVMACVGIVLIVLGYWIWKKEKISLLHDYHYSKVSEENKKAFCTLSGIGLIIIGLGIFAAGVILVLTNSVWNLLVFAAGFVNGLSFLIYAGRKYNR